MLSNPMGATEPDGKWAQLSIVYEGGYAEYEQLVGGVDKLFGEASAKVQENAEKGGSADGGSLLSGILRRQLLRRGVCGRREPGCASRRLLHLACGSDRNSG